MADFLFAPTPHDEAIDFLRSKPVLAREVYDELLPELKAYAITVAGVTSADALQKIRDTLATLPAGRPWKEVKAKIVKNIAPWVVDRSADAETQAKQEAAALRKAELLLRLHGGQAYATASEAVLQRQKKAFPFAQYLTMEDSRVRPEHAALDRVILPVDDPFWAGHTPPWAWGCRCLKVPLSRDDHADAAKADADRAPDEKHILDEFTRNRIETERKLVRNGRDYDVRTDAELGKPNPYKFDPRAGLRPDLATIKARYDAQTWQEFESFARSTEIGGGRTVWDWLGGEPAPRPAAPPEPPLQKPTATPPSPAAAAPTRTPAEAIARAGLDLAKPATLDQIAKLRDELLEQKPAAAADKISFRAMRGYSTISKSTLADLAQGLVDYLPPALAESLPKIEVQVVRGMSALGSYNKSTFGLKLNGSRLDSDPQALRKTFWHELIHWAHDHGTEEFRTKLQVFFAERTNGATEPVQRLRGAFSALYPRGTDGMRDDWADLMGDEYAGRVYGGGLEDSRRPLGLEVATRHLEKLALPADVLLEYWNFKSKTTGNYAWREAFVASLDLLYLTPPQP